MTFKSERPNLSVTYKYRETHGFKGKWTGDKCPTLCLKSPGPVLNLKKKKG